jgi:hypothetical protein
VNAKSGTGQSTWYRFHSIANRGVFLIMRRIFVLVFGIACALGIATFAVAQDASPTTPSQRLQ